MKPHIYAAFRTFSDGCNRASGLRSIFEYLKSVAPRALDCDDILRSSLVLAVSSFDLFIHDVYRTEVVERLSTSKEIGTLKVPFNAVLLGPVARSALIEESIRRDNSFKSFVAPEKLADCLRPLVDGVWDKIAVEMSLPAVICKARLKSVVDLRNRIAHEADVNPAFGGIDLWPIYNEDVERSIEFLRSLGGAISDIVSVT